MKLPAAIFVGPLKLLTFGGFSLLGRRNTLGCQKYLYFHYSRVRPAHSHAPKSSCRRRRPPCTVAAHRRLPPQASITVCARPCPPSPISVGRSLNRHPRPTPSRHRLQLADAAHCRLLHEVGTATRARPCLPLSAANLGLPTPAAHARPPPTPDRFPGRCRSPSPMPGRLPRPASNLAPSVDGNSLRFGSCLIWRCELPWSVFAIGWR